MKHIFTCVAILLTALFLGSGCSTTTSSGEQKKTASQPPDVVSPAVGAPK